MEKQNVNLAVYEELKSRGYTTASIIDACGWANGTFYKCKRDFAIEDTMDVDGEIDFDKLVMSSRKQFQVDMDDVMAKLADGVSLSFLAKKYGIPYVTLWHRVRVMRSKIEG